MKLDLKPEHEKCIQTQIESGRFSSAEDVINTAFKLLENMSDEYGEWLEETRALVDVAIAELDRGEGLDGETVVQEILARFRENRRIIG